MFGWLSRASARASRVNRSAKAGSPADFRRQDFHRHQAVELPLPGLVDRAHAAAAEQLEDFQLRNFRRNFLDRRRDEARGRGGRRAAAWPRFGDRRPAGFPARPAPSISGKVRRASRRGFRRRIAGRVEFRSWLVPRLIWAPTLL